MDADALLAAAWFVLRVVLRFAWEAIIFEWAWGPVASDGWVGRTRPYRVFRAISQAAFVLFVVAGVVWFFLAVRS